MLWGACIRYGRALPGAAPGEPAIGGTVRSVDMVLNCCLWPPN
jgi:hypothetical protein